LTSGKKMIFTNFLTSVKKNHLTFYFLGKKSKDLLGKKVLQIFTRFWEKKYFYLEKKIKSIQYLIIAIKCVFIFYLLDVLT